MLIDDPAFCEGSDHEEHVKVGMLLGSLLSALLATSLRLRNRHYQRICVPEERATPTPTTCPTPTKGQGPGLNRRVSGGSRGMRQTVQLG